VHVRTEDEQLLREILEILLHAQIPLEGRDLLRHPIRERMRPRRRDLQPSLGRESDDRAAQPDELRAKVRRAATDLAPDLDHRLMQLGLHLLEDEMIALEDLGDVRAELARLGIDDLVLFLDPEGQAWGAHEGLGVRG